MARVRIGIGPSAYGIRAPSGHGQVPWERFLDEAHSAGFDGVELGTLGYLPQDGERLREELATRQLELAAGALIADFAFGKSWPTTEQRTQSLCELFRRTGTSRLVLIDAPAAPDQSLRRGGALPSRAWRQMINRVHEVSLHAKQQGIVAAFHPHVESIVETDSEVEQFLADTDPSIVSLCLDTAHYAYFMGDPVELIRRHGRRIAHVHIKNVNPDVRAQVLKRGLRFHDAVKVGVMTDLASGIVDFRLVFNELVANSYEGWAIVEHDLDPNSRQNPYDVAVENRRFLGEIGFPNRH